ncbi:MAG: hypothetical protein L6R38_005554 [Xanthoria sp. 2 TBL-2021]|nr:MAG: hypothetical protein L6R38_005554 [Xanthoria sp. 2 TBL-2021]
MKFSSTSFTFFLTLVAAAAPVSLPACSTGSGTPCKCPAGSEYGESVTFTVIGAAAKDVTALTSDFFETAWLGLVPYAFTGLDNKPGSTRSSTLQTTEGTYNITEKLTKRNIYPDGSSIQRFEQLKSTLPVEYYSKKGSFQGYWITYQTEMVFQYETAVVSSVYSCATGHPLDFGAFMRSAWGNVTSVLSNQGKVQGKSIQPQTIQLWTAGQ